MGLLSIIKKQKLKDKEFRVLVLGLDNAGKTTIVKNVLKEDLDTISPTMGFQITTIQYKGYNLNIWDIGGQTSIRTFWGNYFEKTNIVIWVIDALATERLNESYSELREKIIQQDRLVGVSLLVLLNKIDLVPDPQALKDDVIKLLDLDNSNSWDLLLVSGRTGAGIEQVLDWCISKA